MANTVNVTTLAAAGSLVALAELIDLIKDPEYAKRIPELVEAQETILKAEELRKELASLDARLVDVAAAEANAEATVADLAVQAGDLAARVAAAKELESSLAATKVAVDARQAELDTLQKSLKDSIAAYTAKGKLLDAELAKARAATAEADALKEDYKAKLTALSNL
jgi:chromosome segregation ATPase